VAVPLQVGVLADGGLADSSVANRSFGRLAAAASGTKMENLFLPEFGRDNGVARRV